MARQTKIQYVSFYSAGSAAYKVDPQPIRKKQVNLPKPRRVKRPVVYVDPVAIAGIVVAAVMLIGMLAGIVQLSAAKQEQQALSGYISLLQEENARLEEAYYAGFDLEEIRQIAIARGMIPADQAQVLYIPDTAVEEQEENRTLWTILAGLFA